MEVNEIRTHLQKKSFNQFYIFSGVEWKVQQIYLEQIAKISGKELRRIDSITNIYSKRNNKSFMQKSFVYVVRDDKELMQNEKIQSQLSSIIGNNILILILTSVDKRTKFYKQYKDSIVEFETLKPKILMQYIQKEINLSDKNCEILMDVCEYDYGRCLLEIDKIKQFRKSVGEKDIFDNDAFSLLLNSGAIYQPSKDAIFDFVDAILDVRVNTAFDLYHQCLDVGEATMVMLTVLYNNAKAVLQVQSYHGKDIVNGTGLTQWQINNARKHVGKRSIRELLDIMEICHVCQKSIVMGMIDEEYIMEHILTSIM